MQFASLKAHNIIYQATMVLMKDGKWKAIKTVRTLFQVLDYIFGVVNQLLLSHQE
jgi:hypothetical protein